MRLNYDPQVSISVLIPQLHEMLLQQSHRLPTVYFVTDGFKTEKVASKLEAPRVVREKIWP